VKDFSQKPPVISNVGLPPSLHPVLGLHFGLSPVSTEASMETNWILSKPMEG